MSNPHSEQGLNSQSEPLLPFDSDLLVSLARTPMPFGKYQGQLLVDLPEPYVLWFADKGFPNGKLGQQMALLHTIKVNGLEKLLDPLRR
ncbi:MAG: DUF3820 family protein [Cellvibrionaceae bacterium]